MRRGGLVFISQISQAGIADHVSVYTVYRDMSKRDLNLRSFYRLVELFIWLCSICRSKIGIRLWRDG